MTIETENADTDDLDKFSDTFFGVEKEPEVQPSEDEPEELDSANEDEDGEEPEVDIGDEDTDPEAEDEPEEEPAPKPKGRKTAKERITELTAKNYEAERKAKALEARIAELEKGGPKKEDEPKPEVEDGAPTPDDLLEDGKLKYPLGEFDPKFIRDLTRYTINMEGEKARAKEAQMREAQEMESVQKELETQWAEKVVAAEERLPDLREKFVELETTFRDMDPGYGQYLASTIMSLEYGPDVLHYLASNLAEAQRIVDAGPTAATIALGRLEAKFATPIGSRQRQTTTAPEPAPRVKGSTAVRTTAPDTDNLDAFEDIFFNKKR